VLGDDSFNLKLKTHNSKMIKDRVASFELRVNALRLAPHALR
jgi:hypothetical protein